MSPSKIVMYSLAALFISLIVLQDCTAENPPTDTLNSGCAAINASSQGDYSSLVSSEKSIEIAGTVIGEDKFDTAPTGPLNKTSGDSLFAPMAAGTSDSTYQHVRIVDDVPNGKFIRQTIPAGALGPFIITPIPDRETDHASIEYEIRFDEHFDWRYGGKMGPGFVGVIPGHSIYEPTSGNVNRDIGFSTRLMWHGRGNDGRRPFQGVLGPIPDGRDNDIVTYVYARYPAKDFNGYGWHANLGPELQPYVWHKVEMEVKLNTIGERDGVFKVWIDGEEGFSASDFEYRNNPEVHIEAILYDIHRGGGVQPNWVSDRDTHIDVRNILVLDLEEME